MNKKITSAVNWTKKHSEDLIAGSFAAATLGLTTWAIVWTFKEANAAAEAANEAWSEYVSKEEALQERLMNEHNAGNDVYRLSSGEYLTVPQGSNQKLFM